MPGVVIAPQLAQRRLVQLKQDLAEFCRIRITGRETLAVKLAQCTDQCVAVLLADRAILVPMAAIQAWFLHVYLPAVPLTGRDSVRPTKLIGNGVARGS